MNKSLRNPFIETDWNEPNLETKKKQVGKADKQIAGTMDYWNKELWDAARHDDVRRARQAIAHGANVNAVDTSDDWHDAWCDTALHRAAEYSGRELVELVLQHGANVNKRADKTFGATALWIASLQGKLPVVQVLLQYGADPHIRRLGFDGSFPLLAAAEGYRVSNGHSMDEYVAIVELLLQHGAKVNAASNDMFVTALHAACLENHKPIVQVLLQNGANINAASSKEHPTIHGMTPIEYVRKNHSDGPLLQVMERFAQSTNFLDSIQHIEQTVQSKRDGELVAIVPELQRTMTHMGDFLQLKYYVTAVNAFYRVQTITEGDRNKLILEALQKAKGWCTTEFHAAVYVLAVKYVQRQGIISDFDSERLKLSATKKMIECADFIQEMKALMEQNARNIQNLRNGFFTALRAIQSNFKDLHDRLDRADTRMNGMATAIHTVHENTVASNESLHKFYASMRYKKRIEGACDFISSIANAVSFGVIGSAIKGATSLVSSFVLNVTDFGDLTHLKSVAASIDSSSHHPTSSGDNDGWSAHDALDYGLNLVKETLADKKLNQAISKKNSVVLIAASTAVFTGPTATATQKSGDTPIENTNASDAPLREQRSKQSVNAAEEQPSTKKASSVASRLGEDITETSLSEEDDLLDDRMSVFTAIHCDSLEDLAYELKRSDVGSLLEVLDSRGRTALEFAAAKGRLDMIQLMEDAGGKFRRARPAWMGLARERAVTKADSTTQSN